MLQLKLCSNTYLGQVVKDLLLSNQTISHYVSDKAGVRIYQGIYNPDNNAKWPIVDTRSTIALIGQQHTRASTSLFFLVSQFVKLA